MRPLSTPKQDRSQRSSDGDVPSVALHAVFGLCNLLSPVAPENLNGLRIRNLANRINIPFETSMKCLVQDDRVIKIQISCDKCDDDFGRCCRHVSNGFESRRSKHPIWIHEISKPTRDELNLQIFCFVMMWII